MKLPNVFRSRFVDYATRRNKSTKLNAITNYLVEKSKLYIVWLQELKISIKLYQKLQNICIAVLSTGPVPEHVSFIMDGNRRYAKKSGLVVKKGHEAGGLTLLSLCYACKKIGVSCVSAYAFSIENFNRSPQEVDILMTLFGSKLDEFAKRAVNFQDPLYGSRLRIVGDISLVSKDLKTKIENAEEVTKDGKDFTLYICFPYTSRNDIFHAMCDLIAKCQNQTLESKNLTIPLLTEDMYLDNFSNKCDLLIRTSGHMRLSDYMLWQVHENADIVFTSTLWPDFDFTKLYVMILKWSFFTTLQRYSERGVTLKDRILFNTPFINRSRPIGPSSVYDSLPKPPIAMSITGETDS
ncbi:hypothetical protein HG535_0D03130 [Zygotorulaspora mrakii]|uniref:Alkyl transferase n=1 Tax=Zygotorulaspora mrakii TaxID=42260 RepID=A0A7H9B1S2_ZYGMR|nr:uncharacterized protein HG535_0D03130 [Zygotorulaspora mrakii]QLG72605.1 hypothetical protein HG535_0D03130 [Zygotorulaspora mrakii]